MDLNYAPDEEAFRNEIRAWLRENLPDDLRDKVVSYRELSRDDLLRWHRILAKQGWVAPDWPAEWGGTDWTVVQRYIFEEECGAAACPPLMSFGLRMCAPVLLRFGTPAQKQRFLPRIYQGEDFWCQGYSEPSSGSDLASLQTRAVRADAQGGVLGWRLLHADDNLHRPLLVRLVALENQGAVGAPKSEGVAERITHLHLSRLAGDVVEVEPLVRTLQVHRRRGDLIAQRQHGNTGLQSAGAAEQVAAALSADANEAHGNAFARRARATSPQGGSGNNGRCNHRRADGSCGLSQELTASGGWFHWGKLTA